MTKPDYTAIALVLDRSGSMSVIRDDAQAAVDQFVADQRALPGEATFTLCRFDTEFIFDHVLTPMAKVTRVHLDPRGWTALYDAIGQTISRLGEELAKLDDAERPSKVLFAIMTDGAENSSKDWTREMVFDAIKRQQDEWAWEFVYLGANQDAMAEGYKIGVPKMNTYTFVADAAGTADVGQRLNSATRAYRGGDAKWAAKLNEPEGEEAQP
jgi:hypothetical protein